MKLIKARKGYQVRARFATYLFHIAHNLLIDHYRRGNPGRAESCGDIESVEPADESGRAQPERQAATSQAAERLIEVIDELPDAQREAFLMREEGAMSLDEIAEAAAVPRETAKSRLRYAVAHIRRRMTAYTE